MREGPCSMTSSFAYRLGMARCEDTDEQLAFLRTFGLGIKLLRVARGFSQQALAEAAGLHRTFVGRLERGQHGVNVAELPQLARALGVPARELIPVLDEVDGRD
jgi:ribosome-binding protein aMBF1 (putative translation factor)